MEKSSTSSFQKIVIWFIIVAMTVGSIGAYFVVIIANENSKREQAQQAELQKAYQKQQEEEAKKPKEPLAGYSAAAFDPATATALNVEELKVGTGAKTAGSKSTIKANYFGWTSDGTIFDSTQKSGKSTPVEFNLEKVIEGWTKGLDGAKVGSVRKLTIPTAQAYGDSPQGGAPAGPLQFVVEIVSIK